MALVHVADGGMQSERMEGTHAADAEYHLLLDTGVEIAAVQVSRDLAVGG